MIIDGKTIAACTARDKIVQSINQSIHRTTNQEIKSINRSIDRMMDQEIESINQSINQENQSINQSIDELLVKQTSNQSINWMIVLALTKHRQKRTYFT